MSSHDGCTIGPHNVKLLIKRPLKRAAKKPVIGRVSPGIIEPHAHFGYRIARLIMRVPRDLKLTKSLEMAVFVTSRL